MSIQINSIEAPINTLPFEYYKDFPRRTIVARTAEVESADDPYSIPHITLYSVEEGERGAEVFALQRNFNSIGWSLYEDGIFGAQTTAAVKQFQEKRSLYVDGKFGPQSSTKLVYALNKRITIECPDGIVRSLVEGESGNLIAAVNWNVAGGVDCSYVQRRVYESDYSNIDVVKRAFDGRYQMQLLARSVKNRHDAYFGKPGAKTHEQAWRLGILYHNYEYAADKIAAVGVSGLSSYWTSQQSWVIAIGAHFPDGTGVTTPLEWCQFYSLGSTAHNYKGLMCKYVTDWTV